MAYDYDLFVIGAGSGGVRASRIAAGHGARVGICEDYRVGGTCVIRGCVPKKLLVYGSKFAHEFEDAAAYGWTVPQPTHSWATLRDNVQEEVDRLNGVYIRLLEGAGVKLHKGRGRLMDRHTIAVGEETVTAGKILIATGGAPVIPDIPGREFAITSNEAFHLVELPKRIAIVGAGYIAVEFAGILARLGVEVHQHFRDGLPLRGFDEDLRRRAAAALTAAGVQLHSGAAPQAVRRDGAQLSLEFGEGRATSFAFVLNATGRRPNTQRLGLETLGIALDAHGAVPVDARRHTAAPGVYAIGDVTNHKNLTPVAIAEGRALADSLFGASPREVDLSLVASAVFLLPPIATIGPSENDALSAGHALKVFEADFRPMRQAFIGGAERSYMKLLVDAASDRVLAVHMLGADAPEIVQSLAVALSCGATKAQFDRTIAVHPTAAEEFVLMREPVRQPRPGGA